MLQLSIDHPVAHEVRLIVLVQAPSYLSLCVVQSNGYLLRCLCASAHQSFFQNLNRRWQDEDSVRCWKVFEELLCALDVDVEYGDQS